MSNPLVYAGAGTAAAAARGEAMNGRAGHRSLRWFSRTFLVGVILWSIAGAILGIPHGPGQSIESMGPLQTIHDVAFPMWVGGLAGIGGLLALRAFDSLRP